MKKNVRFFAVLAVGSLIIGGLSFFNNGINKANAYSASGLPTTIKLDDCTETQVRNYYKNLNSLDESERKGTNLLKNLKTILKNGQKYYSYENGENIWKMYEITDRDWDLSPKEDIAGFDEESNTINGYVYGTGMNNVVSNPYIRALYNNRSVTNQAKAWDSHGDRDYAWTIEREHVWPKSQGFNNSGSGGARGDPMHLWAAEGTANGLHSNHPYGYVDKTKTFKDAGSTHSNVAGNLTGKSKTLPSSTATVFEPQDSDKGDIARSIFYMVARYNNYSGSDSDGIDTNNPNLELVNDAVELSSYTSSTSVKGQMGIVSDLLEWNKLDPVDDYEKHRNNLLYNNFTNNRNPFIDFPQWADLIWGNVDKSANPAEDTTTSTSGGSSQEEEDYVVDELTPTSISNPSGYSDWSEKTLTSEAVYAGNSTGGSTKIQIKSGDNSGIISTSTGGVVKKVEVDWHSNTTSTAKCEIYGKNTAYSSTSDLYSDDASVKGTLLGQIAKSSDTELAIEGSYSFIGIRVKNNSNVNYFNSISISWDDSSIRKTVSSVSISPSSVELDMNGTTTASLTATVLGNNNPSQQVSWSSSDASTVTVDDSGHITAQAAGEAIIYATSTFDTTKSGMCRVTVLGDAVVEKGTIDDPYTVSEARTVAVANGTSASSVSETYTVGIICGIQQVSTKYGNATFRISDDGADADYLTIYRCFYLDEVAFTSADQISVGDKVIIYGKLYNYNGDTPETYSGCNIYAFVTEETESDIVSVTLNTNSAQIDLATSSTAQLTVTVVVQNAASQAVTLASSNTTIATVSNTGLVTAHKKGSVIITVKSTIDKTKSDTCQIDIIDSMNLPDDDPIDTDSGLTDNSRYIKITSEVDLVDGYYLFVYETEKVAFNGALETLDVSSNTQSVTISNQRIDLKDNYFVIKDISAAEQEVPTYSIKTLSGLYIGRDAKTNGLNTSESTQYVNTISFDESGNANVAGAGGTCLRFNDASGQKRFRYYASGQKAIQLYRVMDANYYGKMLLNSISCDSTGSTQPTFNGNNWSALSADYDHLNSAFKTIYENSSAKENGNSVERAIARYEYIVRKYGVNEFANFMNRTINPSNIYINNIGIFQDTSTAIIVLIISSLSLVTLFILVLKKKQKYK